MRIDSCRKCGRQQEVSRECTVCEQPIEFECKECRAKSEEQFHQKCVLVGFNYNLLKSITA